MLIIVYSTVVSTIS